MHHFDEKATKDAEDHFKKYLFLTIKELRERNRSDFERRNNLPLDDEKHPFGYEFIQTNEGSGFRFLWGGYSYFFELDRLSNAVDVLDFLAHVLEKNWSGATPERISYFIRNIQNMKRISPLHAAERDGGPHNAKDERSKMTPKLRYQVLRQGNYKCVACGITPELGGVLHVDHIVPIASGGRTEEWNLQILCASCNFGKGASS